MNDAETNREMPVDQRQHTLDDVDSVPSLRDALRTVPQVDKRQWARLGVLTRWAIATRASVLVMTAASALMGGLLALSDGLFNPALWCLTLLGLLLAHATSNLVNDFVDGMRGLDSGDYHRARYGTHILMSGMVDRQGMMRYILVTGLLAAGVGVVLVLLRGGLTPWLMLAGAVLLLGYTWPMKPLGLGEPTVLLVWGPLMVGGSYYVSSGQWSWDVALLGLLYGLGPTAVLFAKHLDKFDRDRESAVRTLPVLLGRQTARRVAAALLPAACVLMLLLVLMGRASPFLLLVFLAWPPIWKAARALQAETPSERPADYPRELWPLWYTHFAFLANRRFAGFFVLGLALDILTGLLAGF